MEQNKQDSNIWKYLPTWKEAKWWIIAGVIWAIIPIHIIILTDEPIIDALILLTTPCRAYLLVLSPMVWAVYLLSLVNPMVLEGRVMLVPSILLGAVLSGLASYILRTIFKLIIGR